MGYESVILICTIVSTIATVASLVLALIKALDDKRNKSE